MLIIKEPKQYSYGYKKEKLIILKLMELFFTANPKMKHHIQIQKSFRKVGLNGMKRDYKNWKKKNKPEKELAQESKKRSS